MKHPDDLTEAELDALDADSPKMTRKVRAELGKKLQEQLRRTQKEAQEGNAKLKTLDPVQKEHEEVSALVQRNVDLIIKIVETQQRIQHPQTGITAITIQNFKGISAPVTIPLRPITLLFGANSAGKSTIIQGLHYARELLERNNANPDYTLLGGDVIELGGFSNLVHRHNLDREIRLRIDITPTADGVPTLKDILGTADQEDEVRVNPEEIQNLLKQLSMESSSRTAEKERILQSLKGHFSITFDKLLRNREELSEETRRRLMEGTDLWFGGPDYDAVVTGALSETLDALINVLERASNDLGPDGKVRLSNKQLQTHLAKLKEQSKAIPLNRFLRARMAGEFKQFLEKCWRSADADRLKMELGENRRRFDADVMEAFQEILRSSVSSTSTAANRLIDHLASATRGSRDLNINPHVDRVSIELVTRWDPDQQIGWFAECNYWVNGQPIIFIRKAKPSSRPTIEQIDLFHPIMLAMDEALAEDRETYDEQIVEFALALISSLKLRLMKNLRLDKLGFDVVRPSTGEVLIEKNQPLSDKLIQRLVECLPDIACRTNAPELLPQARLEIEDAVKRFEERQVQLKKDLGFFPLIQLGDDKERNSVAPSPDRPLPFSAAALGKGREHYADLINQIVVGITALARDHLEHLRYIGPIRAIPDRHHEAPQVEEPARWSNGLGAWDLLLRHYDRAQGKGDQLVEEVSKWFEDKDRLGLGYHIEVTGVRSVAEDSPLMSRLKVLQSHYDELSQQDFRKHILQPLQTSPQSPRVRIVDTRNGTEVGPKDIGIGVAQALPIVVGALDSKCPLLAVEQPELHLHPAAQARLGDLFITQAKKDRIFLIETHSETLMLRIFRRIRETKRDKLPRPELEMRRENIALLFVSAGESGTVISRIRLDDQGKFADPVPGGFFEEGFDELF